HGLVRLAKWLDPIPPTSPRHPRARQARPLSSTGKARRPRRPPPSWPDAPARGGVVMGKHGSMPRVEGDHYQTPDWAIAALAEHIELAGKTIWEPATGAGCMAEALKAAGATVFCSDVTGRGYPLDAMLDFTAGMNPKFSFSGIATNPAYG